MRFFEDGGFEGVLAALLATVALTLGAQMGNAYTISADMAMCIAAAATGRWTRPACFVVIVALAPYFLFPPAWVTLGEYGPLIPILGTGMRGLWRERRWISSAALLVLTALQYHDYPDRGPLFLFGGLVWAGVIAALWLVGTGFTALRHAQQEAQRTALIEQRLVLARDLHDTVARTIARVAMQAAHAEELGRSEDIKQVTEGLHQIGTELRWVMSLLREPEPLRRPRPAPGSISSVTYQVQQALTARGIPTTIAIEGDEGRVSAELLATLSKGLDEAAANVERHAQPGHPCALLITITGQAVDIVMTNECRFESPRSHYGGMGLTGIRELFAQIGGLVTVRQEGTQWVLRMTAPLRQGGYESS